MPAPPVQTVLSNRSNSPIPSPQSTSPIPSPRSTTSPIPSPRQRSTSPVPPHIQHASFSSPRSRLGSGAPSHSYTHASHASSSSPKSPYHARRSFQIGGRASPTPPGAHVTPVTHYLNNAKQSMRYKTTIALLGVGGSARAIGSVATPPITPPLTPREGNRPVSPIPLLPGTRIEPSAPSTLTTLATDAAATLAAATILGDVQAYAAKNHLHPRPLPLALRREYLAPDRLYHEEPCLSSLLTNQYAYCSRAELVAKMCRGSLLPRRSDPGERDNSRDGIEVMEKETLLLAWRRNAALEAAEHAKNAKQQRTSAGGGKEEVTVKTEEANKDEGGEINPVPSNNNNNNASSPPPPPPPVVAPLATTSNGATRFSRSLSIRAGDAERATLLREKWTVPDIASTSSPHVGRRPALGPDATLFSRLPLGASPLTLVFAGRATLHGSMLLPSVAPTMRMDEKTYINLALTRLGGDAAGGGGGSGGVGVGGDGRGLTKPRRRMSALGAFFGGSSRDLLAAGNSNRSLRVDEHGAALASASGRGSPSGGVNLATSGGGASRLQMMTVGIGAAPMPATLAARMAAGSPASSLGGGGGNESLVQRAKRRMSNLMASTPSPSLSTDMLPPPPGSPPRPDSPPPSPPPPAATEEVATKPPVAEHSSFRAGLQEARDRALGGGGASSGAPPSRLSRAAPPVLANEEATLAPPAVSDAAVVGGKRSARRMSLLGRFGGGGASVTPSGSIDVTPHGSEMLREGSTGVASTQGGGGGGEGDSGTSTPQGGSFRRPRRMSLQQGLRRMSNLILGGNSGQFSATGSWMGGDQDPSAAEGGSGSGANTPVGLSGGLGSRGTAQATANNSSGGGAASSAMAMRLSVETYKRIEFWVKAAASTWHHARFHISSFEKSPLRMADFRNLVLLSGGAMTGGGKSKGEKSQEAREKEKKKEGEEEGEEGAVEATPLASPAPSPVPDTASSRSASPVPPDDASSLSSVPPPPPRLSNPPPPPPQPSHPTLRTPLSATLRPLVFSAVYHHDRARSMTVLKAYDTTLLDPPSLLLLARHCEVLHMTSRLVPHLIDFRGIFFDCNVLYLVFENCSRGDAMRMAMRRGGFFPEQEVVVDLLLPLLLTLDKMHHVAKVIHRDLKPESLLLSAEGELRVGGMAHAICFETSRPTSPVGTVDFFSPEMLRTMRPTHLDPYTATTTTTTTIMMHGGDGTTTTPPPPAAAPRSSLGTGLRAPPFCSVRNGTRLCIQPSSNAKLRGIDIIEESIFPLDEGGRGGGGGDASVPQVNLPLAVQATLHDASMNPHPRASAGLRLFQGLTKKLRPAAGSMLSTTVPPPPGRMPDGPLLDVDDDDSLQILGPEADGRGGGGGVVGASQLHQARASRFSFFGGGGGGGLFGKGGGKGGAGAGGDGGEAARVSGGVRKLPSVQMRPSEPFVHTLSSQDASQHGGNVAAALSHRGAATAAGGGAWERSDEPQSTVPLVDPSVSSVTARASSASDLNPPTMDSSRGGARSMRGSGPIESADNQNKKARHASAMTTPSSPHMAQRGTRGGGKIHPAVTESPRLSVPPRLSGAPRYSGVPRLSGAFNPRVSGVPMFGSGLGSGLGSDPASPPPRPGLIRRLANNVLKGLVRQASHRASAGGLLDALYPLSHYTHTTDIWTLGVTLFELLTGYSPFELDAKDDELTQALILFGEIDSFPPSMSKEAIDFLQCCLKKDFGRRSEAAALLSHPLITKHLMDEAGNVKSIVAKKRVVLRLQKSQGPLWLEMKEAHRRYIKSGGQGIKRKGKWMGWSWKIRFGKKEGGMVALCFGGSGAVANTNATTDGVDGVVVVEGGGEDGRVSGGNTMASAAAVAASLPAAALLSASTMRRSTELQRRSVDYGVVHPSHEVQGMVATSSRNARLSAARYSQGFSTNQQRASNDHHDGPATVAEALTELALHPPPPEPPIRASAGFVGSLHRLLSNSNRKPRESEGQRVSNVLQAFIDAPPPTTSRLSTGLHLASVAEANLHDRHSTPTPPVASTPSRPRAARRASVESSRSIPQQQQQLPSPPAPPERLTEADKAALAVQAASAAARQQNLAKASNAYGLIMPPKKSGGVSAAVAGSIKRK